jgi:pre-rRNA-processing protein TSR4
MSANNLVNDICALSMNSENINNNDNNSNNHNNNSSNNPANPSDAQGSEEQLLDKEEEDDEEEENDPVQDNQNEEEDDDESDESVSSETTVDLGFVDDPIHPVALLRHYFPSKLGGKPAWLNPRDLPSNNTLQCQNCKKKLNFLLQIYAPLRKLNNSAAFHRSIYVFICSSGDCIASDPQKSILCLRAQLPRDNPFYSNEAPPKLTEAKQLEAELIYEDQVFPQQLLCKLCGFPGNSKCSKCHLVNYCSRDCQTKDWKAVHKKECATISNNISNSTANDSNNNTILPKVPPISSFSHLSPDRSDLLYPQYEIVTEGESSSALPEEHDFSKEKKLIDEYEADQAKEPNTEEDDEFIGGMNSGGLRKVDKMFDKFQARIKSNPQQIIRFDRGGNPLWITVANQINTNRSAEPNSNDQVPSCEHCGGARVFEFQILPQLLYYLELEDEIQGKSIDWGTLVVYSCERSCGSGVDAEGYIKEFVHCQHQTN